MLAFKLSNRTVDVRAIIAMAASYDKESPQPNFPACARMKATVNASRQGTHDCSISSAIDASSNSKNNRYGELLVLASHQLADCGALAGQKPKQLRP